MNRRAVLQRFGGRQQIEGAINLTGGLEPSSLRQQHAAPQFGSIHAGDIQCCSLSGYSLDRARSVDLLYAARRDGALDFRMQADVVEIDLPPLSVQ